MATTKAISTFNRVDANKVRSDALAALEQLAAKHGLSVKFKTAGSFDSTTLHLAFTFATEKQADKEVDLLKGALTLHGIKATAVGAKLTYNGTKFVVTSYNPRNRARPFILTSEDTGKSALASVDFLREYLPARYTK